MAYKLKTWQRRTLYSLFAVAAFLFALRQTFPIEAVAAIFPSWPVHDGGPLPPRRFPSLHPARALRGSPIIPELPGGSPRSRAIRRGAQEPPRVLSGPGQDEGVAMSAAENKALVRRYLEEVVNTGDVDRLAEFIAPDYLDRNDQGRGIEGAIHVTVDPWRRSA